MSQYTTSMPLEDSPWASANIHDPEDVETYIADYRNRSVRALKLLSSQGRGGENSFLEGAQQAIGPFSMAGRGHRVTSASNFRFAAMKDGDRPTTVFFIADANTIRAQGPLIALTQWCMVQELRRHPDKHKPVTLIADEAGNFFLNGLDNLLTTARGYGLRIHLFLHGFSTFRKTYSRETLNTVLSEAEIQQFLTNTREDEVIEYIQKRLGEQSLMIKSRRGQRGQGLDQFDYREEGRPVKTADEVRRSKKAFVFIRNNKAIEVDVPPIAAIHPWRAQVGIDPFHGKKWLKRVKLRIRRSDRSVFKRLWKRLFRGAGQ